MVHLGSSWHFCNGVRSSLQPCLHGFSVWISQRPWPALQAVALQPALVAAVDIACQEIPAGAPVRGIGLGQRRHRAVRAGLGIFPGLAGILVALGQHVGSGIAGKGKVALGRRRRRPAAGVIEPVSRCRPSWRRRCRAGTCCSRRQPSAIRISVIAAPAGAIADRPTRLHALYRASLYRGGSAFWTAGGRNSELPK